MHSKCLLKLVHGKKKKKRVWAKSIKLLLILQGPNDLDGTEPAPLVSRTDIDKLNYKWNSEAYYPWLPNSYPNSPWQQTTMLSVFSNQF